MYLNFVLCVFFVVFIYPEGSTAFETSHRNLVRSMVVSKFCAVFFFIIFVCGFQLTGRSYRVREVPVPASRSAREVDEVWKSFDAQVLFRILTLAAAGVHVFFREAPRLSSLFPPKFCFGRQGC